MLSLCLNVLVQHSGIAQHGNIWALGYKKGINFNTNPITLIATSIVKDTAYVNQFGNSLTTSESVSYSDCEGQLLVYGSSRQLWNKYHKPIKNGYFIDSKELGLLLIPLPKSQRYLYFFYHVFSGGACNNRYLKCALIDLYGDNGAGEVIFKDKIVGVGGGSNITYAKHSNNTDLWIVHGETDLITNCYLLSDTGLNINPVVNQVYSDNYCLNTYTSNYHNNKGAIPYAYSMKLTRDGKNLICSGIDSSTTKLGCVIMYDFNSTNGKITNPQVLMKFADIPLKSGSFQGNFIYNEISPNDSFIYVAEMVNVGKYSIVQINRKTRQKTTVFRPKVSIYGFQIGPNGQIYFTSLAPTGDKIDLFAITKPNLKGTKCAIRKILSDTFIEFRLAPQTFQPYIQLTYNSDLEDNACTDTAKFSLQVDTSFQNLTLYFGDGDSLYFSYPLKPNYQFKHAYSNTGFYTIQLKAQNPGCNSYSYSSDSIYFALPPSRIKHYIGTQAFCDKNQFSTLDSFKNASQIIYQWDYIKSDTLKNSNVSNFNKTIYKDSNWSVLKWKTLVGNYDCPNYLTYIDSVHLDYLVKPISRNILNSSFGDTLRACLPFQVKLQDSSTNSYTASVDWGDGTKKYLKRGDYTALFEYKQSGTFNLIIADTSSDKCFVNDTTAIVVYAKPISKLFSGKAYQCFNENNFSIKSSCNLPTSKQWIVPPGHSYSFLNDSNLQALKFNAQGTYQISAISTTINGCKDTASVQLRLMSELKAVFDGDSSAKCLDKNEFLINHSKDVDKNKQPVLYRYDTNVGNFNLGTGLISYSKAGVYKFTYILTDSLNCKDSLEISHRVFSHPTLELKLRDTCFGNPVKLDFSSTSQIQTFQIYSGDGAKYNTATYHKYQTPASYTVSLRAANNNDCSDSISQTIRIFSRPVAGLITDTVCLGEILQILPICNNMAWDSISSMRVDWMNGSKLISTPNVIQIPGLKVGFFNVRNIVTSIHNCKDTTEKEGLVNGLPIVDFTWNRLGSSNSGIEVQFLDKSIGGNINNWNFGDGQSISNILNPKHLFADSGKYQVSLLVSNKEGCQDEKTELITVIPYLPVFIPSAFSPNNDGINDVFEPSGTLLLVSWNLTIYNRWGEIVYEGNNKGWDGVDALGNLCQNGVYFYRLITQAPDRKRSIFTNTIHLER